MRKLFALVLVLIVLAAADSVARMVVADRVSGDLRSALDLDRTPEVSLRGFPFLWHLAGGKLPSISVTTDRLRAGPIALERIQMELVDVSFSISDALVGDLRTAGVGSGKGSARLSIQTLEDSLRATGALVGDISLEDLPGAEIEGSTLTFGPARFDLPRLTPSMSYRSVRLSNGSLLLTFDLDRARLRLR